MRQVRQVRHLFDDAQEVWRLHDDGSGLVIDCCFESRSIHLPCGSESDFLNMKPQIACVGVQNLAIFGMQRTGHDYAVPPSETLGHQYGFGGGGRAVPH